MKLSLISIAGIGVYACERDLQFRNLDRHLKRQDANVTFPPILDENERVLIDSFDNTSISTWSYYYSMLNLVDNTETNHGQLMVGWLQEKTKLWLSGQLIGFPSMVLKRGWKNIVNTSGFEDEKDTNYFKMST